MAVDGYDRVTETTFGDEAVKAMVWNWRNATI